MSIIALLFLVGALLVVDICNNVKIAYYKQKLESAGIKDNVKGLSWYELLK